MIKFILEYLFIFITGATLGWVLEVFYRRYFGKARRWINPGFLSGPFLPLYGTGVCLLYIISEVQLVMGLRIVLFAAMTTAIEYLTGLFFLKFYNTRLWDYKALKFNFQGLIAPLYTFFWTLLSLFFYYVLYPYFYTQVTNLYEHLEFSLFIGIFYGIILIDVIESFNVLSRLKKMSDALGDTQLVIHYHQLKLDISEKFEDLTDRVEDIGDRIEVLSDKVSERRPKLRRPSFLLPFRGDYSLKLLLQAHFEKLKDERK